jgi:uncharacterized repeat protein (TIGR03806 family)
MNPAYAFAIDTSTSFRFRGLVRIVVLIAACGHWLSPVGAQPYGLDARVENVDRYFTGEPNDVSSYGIAGVLASDGLAGLQMDCAFPDDGSDRMFIASQTGKIWVVRMDQNPRRAVQVMPGWISDISGETGLMGFTLDPDFAINGYFYFHMVDYDGERVHANRRLTIRRNRLNPPSSNVTSRATEEILFEAHVPNVEHQGGGIRFGPDGYLYFSYGEGRDFYTEATDLDSVRGKILRIDVHPDPSGPPYVVPPDNPFVDVPGALPEIWARGFRNPWRMHFDPVTGDLYVADVGRDTYEEISRVEPAGHHGWPYYEGYACNSSFFPGCQSNPEVPDDIEFTPPVGVFINPKKQATIPAPFYTASVVDGFIYRGTRFPELQGYYIAGSASPPAIFAFLPDPTGPRDVRLLNSQTGVIQITEDPDGEPLFMTRALPGNMFTLEPPLVAEGEFPLSLSQAPWLIDLARGESVDGVLPYDVNVPLWSDGAVKTRFVAVPGLDKVGYRAENSYEFSTHTLFVKNFFLPRDRRDSEALRIVETRLLVRRETGWSGYSYEWNDEESDAYLLTNTRHTREVALIEGDGTSGSQTWVYPSRQDCQSCHTSVKNGVLGFETVQLNRDFGFELAVDNQLRTFEHIGLFEEALPAAPAALDRLTGPGDAPASLMVRAKAYLHANCAMCHQPGGTAPVDIDFRWETPLESMRLVDVPAVDPQIGINLTDVFSRIAPGDPEHSALYVRMAVEGGATSSMPPLARLIADPAVQSVIEPWILQLGGVLTADEAWLEAR